MSLVRLTFVILLHFRRLFASLCSVVSVLTLLGVLVPDVAHAQNINVLSASGQEPPVSGRVSRAQALVALDSVFRWIEQRHPAPYRHRSRASVLRERRALAHAMPDSIDRWWFVDTLAVMVASLNLESTWVFNVSAANGTTVFGGQSPREYFPGTIEWVEDKPIITFGGGGLWPGDEIVRINGLSVDSLIRLTARAYPGPLQHRLSFAAMQLPFEMSRRGATRAPYRVELRRWNDERVNITLAPREPSNSRDNLEWSRRNGEFLGMGLFVNALANRALVIDVGSLMIDSALHLQQMRAVADRLRARRSPALILDLRWQTLLYPWLVRSMLRAMAPTGVFGKTNVPICVLMGAQTTEGAAHLITQIQRRRLARTLGEDAGAWRNAALPDEGRAVPFLSAIVMTPAQPIARWARTQQSLHPQIHVPVWRQDVARDRDLAMDVASNCGALPPPR